MALALVWAVTAGSVFLLGMILIQLFAASQRAGSLVTNTVVFPLLMLGGSFFPFEAMPDGMAAIGRLTPNGWALLEFKWILAGGWDPARVARDMALAALAGAVLFVLCARRLRGKFVQA
jgi:ABC-type multidrug transport system permease subunit